MILYYALLFALAIIPCALAGAQRWPHVLVFWTVGVSLVLAILVVMGAPVVPRMAVASGLIAPQDPEMLQPVFMRNAMLTVIGAAIYVGLAQMQALRMPHALALLMLGTLYLFTQYDLLFPGDTTIIADLPVDVQQALGDDFAQRVAEQHAQMKQAIRITSFLGIAGYLSLAAYQIWLRLTRGPARN
ncbi:hypothetical protein [Antarctobacter jejuensis]|uniref:hypothetical protein n=1 Tax=Antarctobacter jejuensis TaxID=1439938 RepID=UPI003FD6BE9E